MQEIKVIGRSQSHLEFGERPRFQTLWEGNSAPASTVWVIFAFSVSGWERADQS